MLSLDYPSYRVRLDHRKSPIFMFYKLADRKFGLYLAVLGKFSVSVLMRVHFELIYEM